MPPCFGSAASATVVTASNDNTAAASACTLRMLLSLEVSASSRANLSNDSMTEAPRNRQGRRPHWQFGLRQMGALHRRGGGVRFNAAACIAAGLADDDRETGPLARLRDHVDGAAEPQTCTPNMQNGKQVGMICH